MLSILDVASNNLTVTIGNPFVVASLEILTDQNLLVWFTRNPTNATNIANYTLNGPNARTIVLAQLQTETNGIGSLYNTASRGVRLYTDLPLTVGQWTLSISGLVSQDADSLPIPTGTKLVFDLVDKSSQGDIGSGLVESPVSKFIPKIFREKTAYKAIIAGIEAGDEIVRDQARTSFDQGFICTSSGKYLNTKAGDRGVPKPTKLGISDVAFRKLAIDVSNSKLTNDAIMSVLEVMYGTESVRAFVETTLGGFFEVFDKGDLDILIDGKTPLKWTCNLFDYKNPLHVTPIELVNSLNQFFDKSGDVAFAEVTSDNKVRIYSNTKGARSTISVESGSIQPYLQFTDPVASGISFEEQVSYTWAITNPRPGIVRIQLTSSFPFQFNKIYPGDYITIIGENFPLALRGSWPIVATNYTAISVSPFFVQWVEIESSYVAL